MALGDPVNFPVVSPTIQYEDFHDMSREKREAFLKQEADALIEWSKNPESLTFRMFSAGRGYSYQTFIRFKNEYPIFTKAYDHAKATIVARYHVGGLQGKYHSKFTETLLPLMDQEFRELKKEMALNAANAEMAVHFNESQKRALSAELELARLRSQIKVLEEKAIERSAQEVAPPYPEPKD